MTLRHHRRRIRLWLQSYNYSKRGFEAGVLVCAFFGPTCGLVLLIIAKY